MSFEEFNELVDKFENFLDEQEITDRWTSLMSGDIKE